MIAGDVLLLPLSIGETGELVVAAAAAALSLDSIVVVVITGGFSEGVFRDPPLVALDSFRCSKAPDMAAIPIHVAASDRSSSGEVGD